MDFEGVDLIGQTEPPGSAPGAAHAIRPLERERKKENKIDEMKQG